MGSITFLKASNFTIQKCVDCNGILPLMFSETKIIDLEAWINGIYDIETRQASEYKF